MTEKNSKKKHFWSWGIEELDLKNQIENYHTLKITKSYRGISALIMVALLCLSLLLSLFGKFADTETIIWSIILYSPILFFVYKGHRWAMISLMALWTLEKFSQLYELKQGGNAAPIVIWWIAVMAYFWKALKVENEKLKMTKNPIHVQIKQ